MSKKVAYVQHPISKEEKNSYIKKGFDSVVDARFAPDHLPDGCEVFKKPKTKAK